MAKGVSIKRNFFYSSFLTTANYLFTFLTYPYVSRVLGVERIGTVNFIDSVINYFIMLSMLGVTIVGIREIAKSRDNRKELNNTFSSIFLINLALTLLALLILGVTYCLLPELQAHPRLMLLGVAKIVANACLLDWFFTGTENFKMITVRTFIVRSLYVLGTFLFIHTPEDYTQYYFLLTFTIVANALVNGIYIRKFVSLSLQGLQIRKFILPIFVLGLYMFFGNFYSSFNTMFLGLECGDTEVGYFTTATKLFTIIISLFTAFTAVMMPRMSNLLKEGDLKQYNLLFRKSISILIAFCLPAIFLIENQSGNIIFIVSGAGYEGAIIPMMICMPLLLVIGYNQILIHQGLMPLAKDKAVLLSSVGGGLVAFALCFLLIPVYGCIGSAILWLASETVVNIISGYFVNRYIGIAFPLRQLLKSVLWHLPLLAILILTRNLLANPFLSIVLAGAITFLYCFILQCFVLRNDTIRTLFRLPKP